MPHSPTVTPIDIFVDTLWNFYENAEHESHRCHRRNFRDKQCFRRKLLESLRNTLLLPSTSNVPVVVPVPFGPSGPSGPSGPVGPSGSSVVGPSGAAGIDGLGVQVTIPITSGTNSTASLTVDAGTTYTASEIGYGSSVSGIPLVEVATTPTAIYSVSSPNFAFNVPVDSVIMNIIVSFTPSDSFDLPEGTILHLQLFNGSAGFNSFESIPDTDITFSVTTISPTTVLTASSLSLTIPVAESTRLIFVMYLTGPSSASISGIVNAGITLITSAIGPII